LQGCKGPYSLDRIDNDWNPEQRNVQWAGRSTQHRKPAEMPGGITHTPPRPDTQVSAITAGGTMRVESYNGGTTLASPPAHTAHTGLTWPLLFALLALLAVWAVWFLAPG
jgi:hypothetical protein